MFYFFTFFIVLLTGQLIFKAELSHLKEVAEKFPLSMLNLHGLFFKQGHHRNPPDGSLHKGMCLAQQSLSR